MLWKKIKRRLPSYEKLSQDKHFRWVHARLKQAELWRFDQASASKGAALGLFIACLPLPGQMLVAVVMASLLRANLPIALALTWITNPFTFIPLNFGLYKVGQWLTGNKATYHPLNAFDWQGANASEIYRHFGSWIGSMGKPFLVGTSVVSLSAALLGYAVVYFGFKWIEKLQQRLHHEKKKLI